MFARAPEVTTDGSPIIEARGVTKTYDTGTVQVNALKNVGLTIRRKAALSAAVSHSDGGGCGLEKNAERAPCGRPPRF